MNCFIKRLSLVAAALTLATVFFVPANLQGDEFDLKTYITVNQTFQVPGAVLEPNTKYVIKRVDHGMTDPHLLRVMNADENQVLTTFSTISSERMEPSDGTVLTFYETDPGYPKPAREWFYPGRLIGYQFIYPKEKQAEITAHMTGAQPAVVRTAQEAPQPSLEESTPASAEESTIAQNTQPAQPEAQREKLADTTAAQPEAAPEPMPEHNANENVATGTENSAAPSSELPRTAGELPLLALIGLASVGLRQVLRKG